MSKLLRADFRRLWKNKLFYLGSIAVMVEVAYVLINNVYYMSTMEDLIVPIDNLLFMGTLVIGYAVAIVTCLLVGTEYSDGTMRNKTVVGHGRCSIYFSHFLTTTFAALFMMVFGSAIIIAIGLPILGGFESSIKILLPQVLCCLLSIVALNAMVLTFAMLIPSKTISVIVCLLLVIVLTMVLPTMIWAKLDAEPMIPEMSYLDSDGIMHIIPETPNPDYVTGTKRNILQLCFDMLPTNQMYQYGYDELPKNIGLFPLYSLIFIGVFSTAGVCIYKRRDLK